MKKKSESCKKLKRSMVYVRLEPDRLEKWKGFASDRGFASLSGFIINCVENVINPISATRSEIDDTISEFQSEQKSLLLQLKEYFDRLESIQLNKSAEENEDIQDRIIEYLKKGRANEYIISHDLELDTVEVYHQLCNLMKEGKVTQDKKDGIKWKLKK